MAAFRGAHALLLLVLALFGALAIASCGSQVASVPSDAHTDGSADATQADGGDAMPDSFSTEEGPSSETGVEGASEADIDASRDGGPTGQVSASDVVVDAVGRFVVVGTLDGSVDLGAGVLTSAVNGNLLLAQFAPSGSVVWSECFMDGQGAAGGKLATDSLNNIVLATSVTRQIDFGSGPLVSAGEADIVLAKLDSAGHPLWSERFGNAGQQFPTAVAVDSSDRILLAVQFDTPVDFGGGVADASSGGGAIVKLEPSGDVAWVKTWSGVAPRAIAVGSRDEVIATGFFEGTVDFGGGPLVSAGFEDIFVVELDPSGGTMWSKRFGGHGTDQAAGVAVDADGNIVLTGDFNDTLDFGGPPLVSVQDPSLFGPSRDLFVARLDAAGNHLFSQRFGDAITDQSGQWVSTDSSNDILVTGFLGGSADFGLGPLTTASPASTDGFVVKFDSGGTALWSYPLPGAGASVRAEPSSKVLVAGGFGTTSDVPSSLHTFLGGSGAFLVEFAP
jgi:hypothetical protein